MPYELLHQRHEMLIDHPTLARVASSDHSEGTSENSVFSDEIRKFGLTL